jgi:capsular polysaccharide export protein
MNRLAFVHFKSRNTKKLDKVVNVLKKSYPVFIVNLSFYSLLVYFFKNPMSLLKSPPNKAFKYYRNNHLKTFIRSPILRAFFVIAPLHRLSYEIKTRLSYNYLLSYFAEKSDEFDCVLIWGGSYLPQTAIREVSNLYDKKTLFFEISSLPNRIQVDPKGINFEDSLSKDPDFYKELSFKEDETMPKCPEQRRAKVKRASKLSRLPDSFIFIPFQVPSDSQILNFSPWVKNMVHFHQIISETSKILPALNFVIKEHPSFKKSIQAQVESRPNVFFANSHKTKELIDKCDAVLTVNSSVGVEALLSSKKVILLGNANYDIDGLVQRAKNQTELTKVISNLSTWSFDEGLRCSFLKYLYNRHLIKASFIDFQQSSIEDIVKKINPNDKVNAEAENKDRFLSLVSEENLNRARG